MIARRMTLRAMVITLVWMAGTLSLCAESDAAQDPVFQIEFSHPGLSPSHWTMTIHPDGRGHFHSERGSASTDRIFDAPNVDREIQLNTVFAERVFVVAGHHHWFKIMCESPQKVAFMGTKRVSYSGPEGQGACQFNYSSDKEIQALGESLVAVAGTIVEGARLEMLLQHDRLGLDKELETLTVDVNDGRAQQLLLIRGILERLAEDPAVLERVRKRARALLARMDK